MSTTRDLGRATGASDRHRPRAVGHRPGALPEPVRALRRARGARRHPRGHAPPRPVRTGPRSDLRRRRLGRRDEPDYWRDIEALAQQSVPGLHIYDALRELGWDGRGRPVVLGLLADVPDRYRQAVLTNDATKFLGEGWRETWEYAGYFERIVDSLDLGVRKPARRCLHRGRRPARRRPGTGAVRRRPRRQRGGRARRGSAGFPLRDDRPRRIGRCPARAARAGLAVRRLRLPLGQLPVSTQLVPPRALSGTSTLSARTATKLAIVRTTAVMPSHHARLRA